MAGKTSYRDAYQNQVAQLGVAENGEELLLEEELVTDQAAQKAAIRRVQLLVCSNSQNAVEALDIMEALGVAPAQQTPYDDQGHVTGLSLRVYSFPSTSIPQETS